MAAVKKALRSCEYCTHRKIAISSMSYYCANIRSEHYLEKIKDYTEIRECKGGNAKKAR